MSHKRALRPAWSTYTTNGSLRKTAMWLTLVLTFKKHRLHWTVFGEREARFVSIAMPGSPVHSTLHGLSPEDQVTCLKEALHYIKQRSMISPSLASWARSCSMNLGSCLLQPPQAPSSQGERAGSSFTDRLQSLSPDMQSSYRTHPTSVLHQCPPTQWESMGTDTSC